MVQLEDQGFPKRCGHLGGKTVVPVAKMCGKLRAALDARRFAQRVPLQANMVEGGQTPVQSAAELGERGFRIMIFRGGTARAAAHVLQCYYGSLQAAGSTLPWRDQMFDFGGLNALIGTPELLAQGRQYE